MKFLLFRCSRPLLRTCCKVLLASLLFSQFAHADDSKAIRLRTETITTLPRASVSGVREKLAIQGPASGLFLVQFEGPLDPAWQGELRAVGAELVKYVPEDAFIARFNNVAPEKISALAFVRWVGPYRPEYKIHPRLMAGVGKALQANETIAVNILISPQAAAAEIAAVRASLKAVAHESHLRQGTIIQGNLDAGGLNQLASSDAVLWIEPAPKRRLVDEFASKVVGGDDGAAGTPTVTQRLGFGGTGVTVCVADTGLDTGDTNTMHPDLRGRVAGFRYYGGLGNAADEYGHGTHVAGIVAGNAATGETDPDTGAFFGLGVASHSSLLIERIFDSDGLEVTPFPSDEQLTRDAVRGGAQIGSNSWGTDNSGEYDTDASQFDELVRDADASTPGDQPYILVFAAGNSGPNSQSVYSPGSAKNVLSVGASENVAGTLALTYGLYADGPDTMADFSSRGPCEDGRLKPDVVAPGTWISSLASSEAFDLASVVWMTNDQYYVYIGGTSMACPHGSGAAASFVQYYRSLHTNATPSPALVKAALINSADELDELNGGPGPLPNYDEGWGRITLTNIIVTNLTAAPRYYDYVDQAILLTNGQVYTRHALLQGAAQPLKITLAYTDVPGFPGAIPALVNDLDLEVIGPDGTLYRGNQFAAGDSIPNAPSADNLNNVEAVHLAQPLPGDYTVRIRARNIVADARLDTAVIDQDFALVISGDITRPGTGAVLLDRTDYTAPGVIRVQVFDPARSASNTVNVLVKSSTESAGENYLLTASGNYGAFTGTVATAVGTATVDGRLQIHNGDAIEADYLDSSGTMRIARATADLVSPVLTGVTVSVDLGITTITWQTSEAADSTVRYGTNRTLNLAASSSSLTTSHSIRLRNLSAGQIYYFLVSSTDAAGNNATNDNSGAYFTFVAGPAPTVLLVDAYEQATGSPFIDVSSYTNALTAAGYNFSVWKVTERGSPQLSDLEAFPVVFWRTTDDIVNYDGTNNTLTAQQQFMIQTYLNEGGSFFMASLGILSQLGDVSFRRNVLQVARFVQNPNAPLPCSSCDEYFGVPAILGAAPSPVTSGMNMTLDYNNYPTFDLGLGEVYGPDFSDTFTPGASATPILFEAVSGKPCGMSYPRPGVDSPGRVVFLSFPLDVVPPTGSSPNNEVVLLGNVLRFLAPGARGVGSIYLDNTVYTIPDRVTVEVGDSDLTGSGQAQVSFTSSSRTNVVTVVLTETTHPGLFRGFVTLVATNPAPSQLAVRNGDIITAAYFDASNHSNVVALAAVDTVPPVISQVTAVTGFGQALVSWTTSKPADSLVQYGGASGLLDRTAYAAQLVTNHAVLLSGLSANRTYFYQVASRDAAGNTTVDDNQGALFTFQTQKAPQPPWFDDLEKGAANWTVVPDPVNGSDMNWALGTPNNGLQTTAHSGTNAWGSDLHGQQFNFLASSYLFSPVIDLSGLSQATLTFWDCFDFSSGFEQGQVMVSTNSAASPSSLPVLADFSGLPALDWEQETLDLTPYVGKTIQVVWDYVGVSTGAPLYGWLVDDVRITGVYAGAAGTIVILKNVGQGTFTLTGPLSQSGTSLITTITNAPQGQYSISFSDIAFYQTPPAQTNILASSRSITFSGNYTFVDTSHNGISDAWQQYYFGSVSTNRTQLTDTDGDGMTDYEEFIAGTNPTNAASKFIILSTTVQTNRSFQLQWSAIPGRVYQVQSSTDMDTWLPVTEWLQAVTSPMSYRATNSAAASRLYRVQVRP